jgi:hypothetical protein
MTRDVQASFTHDGLTAEMAMARSVTAEAGAGGETSAAKQLPISLAKALPAALRKWLGRQRYPRRSLQGRHDRSQEDRHG